MSHTTATHAHAEVATAITPRAWRRALRNLAIALLVLATTVLTATVLLLPVARV